MRTRSRWEAVPTREPDGLHGRSLPCADGPESASAKQLVPQEPATVRKYALKSAQPRRGALAQLAAPSMRAQPSEMVRFVLDEAG